MTSYQKYLIFKSKYDMTKDKYYIDAVKYGHFDIKDFDDEHILYVYIQSHYEKNGDTQDDRYYDINFNIIRNFITILTNYLYIEVVKYMYYIWNKPNISDNIRQKIDIIKNHLIETANLSKKEFEDIIYNPKNPKYKWRQHGYYTSCLYVYYPLLDNWQDLIIKLINVVPRLSDAQDMLMYGIYQVDSEKLFPFMKVFLETLMARDHFSHDTWTGCFDITCEGIGALQQFVLIVNKLRDDGYNFLENIDIDNITYDELKYQVELGYYINQ